MISSLLELAQWISHLGRGPLYFIGMLINLSGGVYLYHKRSERRGTKIQSLNTESSSPSHPLSSPSHPLSSPSHPLFFLCLGWRLWCFWVIGVLLNLTLKHLIAAPRPWWIDSAIHPLSLHPSSGYGMPSGHTQSAIGVLFFSPLLTFLLRAVAHRMGFSKKHQDSSPHSDHLSLLLPIDRPSFILSIISVLILSLWPLSVAWSRVYLHAHDLPQVCAGGLVGITWLLMILALERSSWGPRCLAGFVCIFSGCLTWLIFNPTTLKMEWVQVIERAQITSQLSQVATSRVMMEGLGTSLPSIKALSLSTTLVFIIGSLGAVLSLKYIHKVQGEPPS